jgi:hypothetical protein
MHDGYVLDVCLPILRLSPLPCSFDSDTSPPPLSPFRTRRSHWLHTIIMSRAELDRVFNNTAIKKRSVNLFPFSRWNGCNVPYRTHPVAILAISLVALRHNPANRLSARGSQHVHGIRADVGQAKEDCDRPKMLAQRPALPSLTSRLSHPRRLFKRPPKRHTGLIDYPLGIPDTSDTYFAIPHMVTIHPLSLPPHTRWSMPKTPQPFSLDSTQTLLSLLDILSAFYAKLAKLLGPSPFLHASQHMLCLSPHPGVSYPFQNQTQASATDDALGGPIGGSVLSSSCRAGRPRWASSCSR